MNATRLVPLLAITLVAFGAPAALAQPAESTFQLVQDIHISPGKNVDFEALLKARNGRKAEGSVTFGARANVAEGLPAVYRVTTFGLENMAAIDTLGSQVQAMPAGEPGAARGVIDHIESSIRRTRPDLNYFPENLRVPVEEWGFLREVDIYLQFGRGAEAAEIIEQVRGLYEQHDIRNPLLVTSSVTGSGPDLRVVVPGRNAADLYTENQRVTELLGDEFQELVRQMGALSRRVVYTNRFIRRDLGYQPSN